MKFLTYANPWGIIFPKGFAVSQRNIAAELRVIKKLLQPIIPNDTLESDLASLFAKYPFADKRKNTYLGFPDDWHNDKGVWQ